MTQIFIAKQFSFKKPKGQITSAYIENNSVFNGETRPYKIKGVSCDGRTLTYRCYNGSYFRKIS